MNYEICLTESAYLSVLERITKKTEVAALLKQLRLDETELQGSAWRVANTLLTMKIRFPLLEFAGNYIGTIIPKQQYVSFLDELLSYRLMGGWVIAGVMLRQLEDDRQAFEKASAYILLGDQWYVCDIICERVMGEALLMRPESTLPEIRNMTASPHKWLVRGAGVAIHYAVKKGVSKIYVNQLFEILLTCANTQEFHTKKGIGWAAKTIAKFHPDVIQRFQKTIEEDRGLKTWFKTKIKIGLGRSEKYAGKYNG